MEGENRLIVFENKKIRRVWHKDDWWFSVVDVVGVLTESLNIKDYIRKMRIRDEELGKGWGQIVTPLSISTTGGKQKLNCANIESLFRIIQSIPSKKAEPFKRWLAKVGHERIQEIENPELAQDRMKQFYEQKGYSKNWIEKRLRGIAIRQDLTDEWKNRGIEKNKDFAILTNEIARATFGVSIGEHKKIKGLEPKFKNQNLRDHMTDLELIFGILGEASTAGIARGINAQGFEENKIAAKKGGEISGNARKELETESGEKVVNKENYLDIKKERLIGKK